VTATHTEIHSYSIEATAELAGVDRALLLQYCQLGLLGADRSQPDAQLSFDEHAIYLVRRIEHLRLRHGASLQALPLICDLLHEVEQLRAEVRFLRDSGRP
jgi:DNA-binding transcriptional MerR regulator